MRSFLALLAALMFSSVVCGQITIPDVIAPYQPIVAGCNCIIPQNGEATFSWQTDDQAKSIMSDDTRKLYVWAPPGPHMIRALVVVKEFQDVQVLVVDPADPNNRDKWKVNTIKVIRSIDFQNYEKRFTVGNDPGPNPPGPTPPGPNPPGPTPTEPFSKEVFAMLKAIPAASYKKEKAIQIAENFKAVAAQAVATNGWNLNAFVTETKNRNHKVLTPEEIQAWSTPFFNPLATYQSQEFARRGLNTSDVQGIAKLWNDTHKAITEAANAIVPVGFTAPIQAEFDPPLLQSEAF